jgi:hypothetical protein
MSLRPTILSIALLLSAAAMMPMPDHAPARAQESAATTQLADDTASSNLDKRALRKRIKALRQAIKSGNLTREERRQAKAKIKAYRSEVQALKAGGEETDAPVKPRKKRDAKKQTASKPAPASGGEEQVAAKPPKSAATGDQVAAKPAKQPDSGEPTAVKPTQAPDTGNQTAAIPPKAPATDEQTAAKSSQGPDTGDETAAIPPKAPDPAQEKTAKPAEDADAAEEEPDKISEADCKDVWSEANENGDDVLADDEAAPFASSMAIGSGSEPTIRQTEFMDACIKGAFKDIM